VERPTYVRPTLNLSFFIGGSIKPPEPDMLMRDGQDLRVADMRFRVIHVPGHTPGGAALFGTIDGHNVLFTGDSLFAGSIGRTDFPGGNARQLIDGIRSRLLVLPDDTRVYPGHGPETTIAQERRDNPFLLDDL
jgi:glyoxylase-like metal-dependent hydrolase (beta-lactamase superfamily II)